MQVQILEELESNYEASRTKGRCLLLALGTGKLIELPHVIDVDGNEDLLVANPNHRSYDESDGENDSPEPEST